MKWVCKLLFTTVFLVFILSLTSPAYCGQSITSSFEKGIESLSSSLMKQIADKYFDYQKKQVIKVMILDFTDEDGDKTIGSRYISDRIRMAFAEESQFSLSAVSNFEKLPPVDPTLFAKDPTTRSHVISLGQSDAYILGVVKVSNRYNIHIDARVFDRAGEPILLGRTTQNELKAAFNPSGYNLFKMVVAKKVTLKTESDEAKVTAEVIFLTQPIDDDVNGFFFIKNGLLLPIPPEKKVSSKYDYGTAVESHIVSSGATNNVISRYSLQIWPEAQQGEPIPLECYVLPRTSRYFLIQDDWGREKYSFDYLWYYPGMSEIPAPRKSGMQDTFYVALKDWPIKMLTGTYTGLATLRPIRQRFDMQEELPVYASKFRFKVDAGLNIFVVNYSCHRDESRIYVNKIRLGRGTDLDGRAIGTLLERLTVTGSN